MFGRSAPGQSLLAVVLSVVAAGALVVGLVATGQLIDAASRIAVADPGAAEDAWTWFRVLIVGLAAGPVAAATSLGLAEIASARYLSGFYDLVADTGASPRGLLHVEDPGWSDRLAESTRATRDWLFLAGLPGSWGLLSTRLAGIGAVVLVVGWRWWVPLILIVSWVWLSRAQDRWSSTLFDEIVEVTGHERRRASYLRELIAGRASAKEVRLFDLAGWLGSAYVASWQRTMDLVQRSRWRGAQGVMLPMLMVVLATGGATVLLVADAWSGRVAPGGFVTAALAVLGLSALGPQGDDQNSTHRVMSVLDQTLRLRADLGLPALPAPPEVKRVLRPSRGARGIELDNVSFGYPGTDHVVLQGLSVSIPAGQSVGIVGPNGAGKSTLIKLLCGLYRPDQGTVRIDGCDPADSDDVAAAVIFQDFIRFGVSARANVEAGVGWAPLPPEDLKRVAEQAGIADLVHQLPQGWDTPLSSGYAGGTDLSGGQWQRVALARALAALPAAGILVLDEPTSALDVHAEIALFEQLLELAGSVTTLLVSHRLSGVRRADRIIVLDTPVASDATDTDTDTGGVGGARVVEDGTHAELMKLGGVYARMFALQAARFQDADRDVAEPTNGQEGSR